MKKRSIVCPVIYGPGTVPGSGNAVGSKIGMAPAFRGLTFQQAGKSVKEL